jgi:hypothetical protein
MEKPLVTVVTVTYNSARYVRDTIESVLAQTYSNIEYIIADDCSKDDTWKIVQEYADMRIKAYRNETNLREYPNRNKAIDLATGKYLIFIDGDDIIFPHGIGFFVSMMEAFPKAAMAIQKNYINNLLYPALFEPEDSMRNFFYSRGHLLTSSFASNFFRTDVLKKWKLNTKYTTGDEEIRLKIAATHPVLFVAGWVSWPRETPGQASATMAEGVGHMETYRMTDEVLQGVIKDGLDPALTADMQSVQKKKMARYILSLLRKGKFGVARNCMKQLDFRFAEVLKYRNYVPRFNDVLEGYTPASPLKKGFLHKFS